jgi:hypothetical protein
MKPLYRLYLLGLIWVISGNVVLVGGLLFLFNSNLNIIPIIISFGAVIGLSAGFGVVKLTKPGAYSKFRIWLIIGLVVLYSGFLTEVFLFFEGNSSGIYDAFDLLVIGMIMLAVFFVPILSNPDRSAKTSKPAAGSLKPATQAS